jgi:Endoribonuclease L-PSP
MLKKQLTSKRLRQPNGHFSQATMIEAKGRLVFISGMTARRPDGSIAGIGNIQEQTKQVCENLKAAVEEAGGTLDDTRHADRRGGRLSGTDDGRAGRAVWPTHDAERTARAHCRGHKGGDGRRSGYHGPSAADHLTRASSLR